MSRPPAETAAQKARMAEDAWNSRDRARVAHRSRKQSANFAGLPDHVSSIIPRSAI